MDAVELDRSSSSPAAVTSEIEARPYQLELLDAAIEDNTIVLLGTGAGKTFIAVMLIRELSYQIVRPYDEPGSKRTVFLVNTVPLVSQQARYIRTHTALNVGEYWGEMGVDAWGVAKWTMELREHNILVMTRQIFLDSLTHNFMRMSQVNLIIFDECHHAVKNDPYVQIMRFYNECPQESKPHILGLSASIVSGKCKPADLPCRLHKLEATLHSRIETARDLKEVARFATNPEESIVSFGSSDSIIPRSIKECLCGLLEFICQQTSNKENKEDYNSLVSDVMYSLENISISSAKEAADMAKELLMQVLTERYDLTKWDKKLAHLILTNFTIFAQKCDEHLKACSDKLQLTPKLRRLLDILAESSPARSQVKTRTAGIVFVERRVVAACIASLITRLSGECPELKHIKCAHMVGHGAGGSVLVQGQSSSMNVKRQQEILQKFRTGAINLLIATSVVEEGLDVPKCNLVVRYDFPKTFQSYVQSQGRARAKESKYVLLVQENLVPSLRAKLSEYSELAQALQKLCHDRDVPNEDAIERAMRQLIPPYKPFGRDGAQISIDGSLSLVHKYCQNLPKPDKFTVLAPEFTERASEGFCKFDIKWYPALYTTYIRLPMSSPVREANGPAVPSVKVARKAAALEVVRLLHQAGELNDHLKQVKREEEDSDEEDDHKMKMKKVKHVGTKRRIQYYRKQVPTCLQDCHPRPGMESINHLYIFVIKEADTGCVYMGDEYQHASLGLLTSKPIPHWRVPQFSLYIKKKELSVTLTKNPSTVPLTPTELSTLQTYHNVLFKQVLTAAAAQSLQMTDDSYLVVPLQSIQTSINFDIARHFARMAEETTETWSAASVDKFVGCLVSKAYCTELTKHGQERLYEVMNINKLENPTSPFPESKTATNYVQYFQQKYNYAFSDLTQPSLTCKPVGMGTKSLVLTTCNYRNAEADTDPQASEIKLFPELCKVYPLPAYYWKLCRHVPSLINRLQSLLMVDELSATVAEETGIGFVPAGFVITTKTSLRSGQDLSTGRLSTRSFWNDGTGDLEATEAHLDTVVAECGTQRMPDNALLLQAVTSASANDSINLERLESLGDSFLKLVTSVDLYCSRHTYHEGRLTTARMRRISNFNLLYLATTKRISKMIVSRPFDPLNTWLPPCYCPSRSTPSLSLPLIAGANELAEGTRDVLYQKIPDKSVADVVEALIGAYIVAGGIEAGVKFLLWLGLKLDSATSQTPNKTRKRSANMDLDRSLEANFGEDSPTKKPRTMSCESAMSICTEEPALQILAFFNPLLLVNSSAVFSKYCFPPHSTILQGGDNVHEGIARMTSTCDTLMQKLKWTFRDRALLLQALTHPSYTKNRITDSYQRLEFLGDAILDYLITCHIYCRFPKFSPGEITDMRSALVNNITFAKISVTNLDLSHYLLQLSPALFRQTSEFVEAIKRLSKVEGKDIYGLADQQTTDYESMEAEAMEEGSSSGATDETWRKEEEEKEEEEEVEELDPPKALGDILEALAGAVFLDSGLSLETVWNVFKPFFEPLIEQFSDGIPIPPVKELYEKEPSILVEKSKVGTRAEKNHRCTITVVGKDIQVSAVAKTYKAAKNAAARRALKKLAGK